MTRIRKLCCFVSVYDVINTSSSILVCWMTVNRWVAVCRPHSYNTIFTTKRVNYMLLSTIALSLPSCALSFSICLSHFPPKGQSPPMSSQVHPLLLDPLELHEYSTAFPFKIQSSEASCQ